MSEHEEGNHKADALRKLGLSLDGYGQIHPPRHQRDENGICWKVRTVRGDEAWILCGRSSYEAVIRCDQHSPLSIEHPPTP